MEMGVNVLVNLRQFLSGEIVAIARHLCPPGLEGVGIVRVGGGKPIPAPAMRSPVASRAFMRSKEAKSTAACTASGSFGAPRR